jgi:hypothetical protein
MFMETTRANNVKLHRSGMRLAHPSLPGQAGLAMITTINKKVGA